MIFMETDHQIREASVRRVVANYFGVCSAENFTMTWKHYKASYQSVVAGICEGQTGDCHLEIGMVSTGKSRVFAGYYCRIDFKNEQIVGEDSTMFCSVRAAVQKLGEKGWAIPIYCMVPDFTETGLSQDSGWGYVTGERQAVLMIDEVGKLRETTHLGARYTHPSQ